MLVAISKYTKPLAQVDVYRSAHHEYLKPLFASGKLLVAGRQTSNVGGVIIAKTRSKKEFEDILANDPFVKAQVTEYKIFEFTPSFYDDAISEMFEG